MLLRQSRPVPQLGSPVVAINDALLLFKQELLHVGMALQAPLPVPMEEEPKYVALLSGLGLGDEASDPAPLSLVADYLGGLLGGAGEQNIAAQV